MANLNKVMLIGNLTRDPEIKYTPKGTAVADIGLAVNRNYTTEGGEKREEVTFIDVELWGRQAELAGEYLKKGRPVFIEGRLKLDTWDDKQTGQKKSKMRVVGEMMQFLGSRDGGGGGGESHESGENVSRGHSSSRGGSGNSGGGNSRPNRPAPSSQKPAPSEPELEADEDDIPF